MKEFFSLLDQLFSPLVNSWFYWIAVILGGLLFTLALKGIQFRRIGQMAKNTFGRAEGQSDDGISPFLSSMLAIGGRVGPGNVVGVTIAIGVGGPGALLWFWVVALLGIPLAYAEALLGQLFKEKTGDNEFNGGPAFYMEKGIALQYPNDTKSHKAARATGKGISKIYAIVSLVAFSAFIPAVFGSYVIEGAGKTIDSNFTFHNMHTFEWIVTIVVAVALFALLIKGITSVMKLAGMIVPVMAGAFFIVAFVILFGNITAIPAFFGDVFTHALDKHGIVGGVAGASISTVISRGVTRGLFATESGSGTGSIAGSSTTVDHPARVAFSQSFAIFFVIGVATLTGFAIWKSNVWLDIDAGNVIGTDIGMDDTSAAFGMLSFGESFGKKFIPLIIMFFAFTSLIAASSYSLSQAKFMVRNKSKKMQSIVLFIVKIINMTFVLITPILVTVADNPFAFGDFSLMTQILTNLIAMILLLPVIKKVSKDFEKKTKDKWDKQVDFDPDEVGVVASDVWKKSKKIKKS